jgi:hypothetical protein
MSVQPFVLRPDQHEPALNVVGTQVTVLASNVSEQAAEAAGRGLRRAGSRVCR